MNEAYVCKRLRKEFDKTGFTLLVYYGIMSAVVSVVMVMQMLYLMIVSPNMSEEMLTQTMMGNGWGYVLATAIGAVILLLWKKKEFCFRTIWKPNRRMTVGSFFAILCVFLSAQLFFQIGAMVTEWFFNLFGLSVMESLEMATGIEETFSMFLYGCILAPIFEEVLFRGLLLRTLEPFGKKFAIFATAFLFGLFHANLLQSPFAFAVGLVLGYVTVEYSMVWAVILHMINNLVIADMLTRVTSFLPETIAGVIIWLILLAFAVAGLVVLIRRREDIRSWRKAETIHGIYLRCFFGNGGMICFLVIIGGMLIYTLTALIAPMG